MLHTYWLLDCIAAMRILPTQSYQLKPDGIPARTMRS